MTNRKDNKQSQGDQRKNALKNHPEHIINNPAMQYSGGEEYNSSLKRPMNSVGGGLANSKRLHEDENLDNMDYNKSGQLKNTGVNEQKANNKVDYNKSRPVGKFSGKEGKTMVKNVGMHNNDETNIDETESNI